jgi:hypothetical protein
MANGNSSAVGAVAAVAIVVLVGLGIFGGLRMMDDNEKEIELPDISIEKKKK